VLVAVVVAQELLEMLGLVLLVVLVVLVLHHHIQVHQ
jgi:hypothetical protein